MKDKDAKRQHKATFAADKKNGGYLVRVQGPHATAFAGRSVPVTKKDGTETVEDLDRLIWSGMDDGEISGYAGPCALYTFKPKEKELDDEIPF